MAEYANIPDNSQFKFTPVYKVDGAMRFGLRQSPVSPLPSDRQFTVTAGLDNRLDLISNLFYGTPELWWVIADNNGIVDPMFEIPVGTVLRIPAKNQW